MSKLQNLVLALTILTPCTISYTYATGHSLTGTVDGTLQVDNNTVTGLHDLSAIYSPDPGLNIAFNSAFFDEFTLNAVGIQFGGFENSPTGIMHPDFGFVFVDLEFPGSAFTTVGNFDAGDQGIDFPFGTDQLEGEPISSSNWVASAVPVPEPSAFQLVGLAIAAGCLGARSRRSD